MRKQFCVAIPCIAALKRIVPSWFTLFPGAALVLTATGRAADGDRSHDLAEAAQSDGHTTPSDFRLGAIRRVAQEACAT